MKLSVSYLSQFLAAEGGFRGDIYMFLLQEGITDGVCVNRPHTETFMHDQSGIHADVFSAESGEQLQPRRFRFKRSLVCLRRKCEGRKK